MSGTWRSVGSMEQLAAAGRLAARFDDVRIGVFMVGNALYAINDLCTHGNACLTEGELDGYMIECPLHAGLFDLRSGKACSAPAVRDTRTYPVKVEDGQVFVQMDSAVPG